MLSKCGSCPCLIGETPCVCCSVSPSSAHWSQEPAYLGIFLGENNVTYLIDKFHWASKSYL